MVGTADGRPTKGCCCNWSLLLMHMLPTSFLQAVMLLSLAHASDSLGVITTFDICSASSVDHLQADLLFALAGAHTHPYCSTPSAQQGPMGSPAQQFATKFMCQLPLPKFFWVCSTNSKISSETFRRQPLSHGPSLHCLYLWCFRCHVPNHIGLAACPHVGMRARCQELYLAVPQ